MDEIDDGFDEAFFQQLDRVVSVHQSQEHRASTVAATDTRSGVLSRESEGKARPSHGERKNDDAPVGKIKCERRYPGSASCRGSLSGDHALRTYRWEVGSIAVRDGTSSSEELAGHGDIVFHTRRVSEGTLFIVNAILHAAGGGVAMDVPREAITSLATNCGEDALSGLAAHQPRPTHLSMGLGIGCTIMMQNLVPAPQEDVHAASACDAEDKELGAELRREEKSTIFSTPERRQLDPIEFPAPSPERAQASIDRGPDKIGDKENNPASPSGPPVASLVLQKFDSVLTRLVHRERHRIPMSMTPPNVQPLLDPVRPVRPELLGCSVTSGVNDKTEGPCLTTRESRPLVLQASQREDSVSGRPDGGVTENGGVTRQVPSKENVPVPDDEWRRPFAISPPNKRASSSGRKRPRVRRRPEKGPVVLDLDCLDEPMQTRGGRKLSGIAYLVGNDLRASLSSSRGSGGGALHAKKNSSSVAKAWLAMRKALHKRYRNMEETKAAEQTSVETGEGSAGIVLCPGVRVFRRQEHAFTYADTLEKMLTPEDAAQYKVLSFETSATGSRKFIVCDIRRFEEMYPFTAQPHEEAQQQALKRKKVESQHRVCLTNGVPFGEAEPSIEHPGSPRQKAARGAAQSSPMRHVYEIIREGSPCRMYFDLEFTRAPNPDLDGEELVKAWINVVAGKLQQEFGISVGPSNFLDLDSSSPKKFSRHLIVHLPGGQLFEDNSHVGKFVNDLAADLEAWKPPSVVAISPDECAPANASCRGLAVSGRLEHESREYPAMRSKSEAPPLPLTAVPGPPESSAANVPPFAGFAVTPLHSDASEVAEEHVGSNRISLCTTFQEDAEPDSKGSTTTNTPAGGRDALRSLWVRDGDGRMVLFADVSVYTRNRCFRLVGSSKYGKAAMLRVAGANQRTIAHVTGHLYQNEARIVTRTILHDSFVVPIGPKVQGGGRLLSMEGGGSHRYSRHGQVRRSPAQRNVRDFGMPRPGESNTDASGTGGEPGLDGWWRVAGTGFGSSPFPSLDAFLRTLICEGGVRGDLRQWHYTAHLGVSREGNDDDEHRSAADVRLSRRLTHQVANNRWCWNIGRAHKSNHVFLVTDLCRREVRQYCHDQDCRRSGYRSRPVILPADVMPADDDIQAYELELGVAAAMRESPADWAALQGQ